MLDTKALDIRENLNRFQSKLKSLKNEFSTNEASKQEENSKEKKEEINSKRKTSNSPLKINKIKDESSNLLLKIKKEKFLPEIH